MYQQGRVWYDEGSVLIVEDWELYVEMRGDVELSLETVDGVDCAVLSHGPVNEWYYPATDLPA